MKNKQTDESASALNKSERQSALNEAAFQVELITARILSGCPNDAAELKSLSFVSDLFSFAGMAVEMSDMAALTCSLQISHFPAQTCRRLCLQDKKKSGRTHPDLLSPGLHVS